MRKPSATRYKRTWILSAALLATASVGLTTDAEAQKRRRSGAKLHVEPEEHDFGAVGQNQKLVHEFTITNEGTENLEIRRISTSCGCAAAITAERVIGPGESTVLEVTIETRKYKGRIERSVSVATNDPKVVHTVRVQAFVEVPE